MSEKKPPKVDLAYKGDSVTLADLRRVADALTRIRVRAERAETLALEAVKRAEEQEVSDE